MRNALLIAAVTCFLASTSNASAGDVELSVYKGGATVEIAIDGLTPGTVVTVMAGEEGEGTIETLQCSATTTVESPATVVNVVASEYGDVFVQVPAHFVNPNATHFVVFDPTSCSTSNIWMTGQE